MTILYVLLSSITFLYDFKLIPGLFKAKPLEETFDDKSSKLKVLVWNSTLV